MSQPPEDTATTRTLGRREKLALANDTVGKIHAAWPERPDPNPHVATRMAVMRLLDEGISPDVLITAAHEYALHCETEHTPPRFRYGSTRFYRDGIWRRFAQFKLHGLTREQWRQSGQDLKIFDTAWGGGDAA